MNKKKIQKDYLILNDNKENRKESCFKNIKHCILVYASTACKHVDTIWTRCDSVCVDSSLKWL